MVQRLESHQPGKIRIWTGLDRSWLYEIYHFLAAHKDLAADEQGGWNRYALLVPMLSWSVWRRKRVNDLLSAMAKKTNGCQTRPKCMWGRWGKVCPSCQVHQRQESRVHVYFWIRIRWNAFLFLMMISQLIKEGEIVPFLESLRPGVAFMSRSALPQQGHRSQLGMMSLLHSRFI